MNLCIEAMDYSTCYNYYYIHFYSHILLSLGLSDPGYHLLAGEHPGHYCYSEEQEPALTHVLLHLQVNSSQHETHN